MDNPFIIKSYESKDLFCDREKELQLMLRNCVNQSDMTLISQRRMGKTGLILRLFDELKTISPDIHTIYLDIFASRNIDDFIKLYMELHKRFIDNDGEAHEPSDPYEVGEEDFCCGHPLKYMKKTKKYVCEHCGAEYEAE